MKEYGKADNVGLYFCNWVVKKGVFLRVRTGRSCVFQMLVNTQVCSASADKCPLLGMGLRD